MAERQKRVICEGCGSALWGDGETFTDDDDTILCEACATERGILDGEEE